MIMFSIMLVKRNMQGVYGTSSNSYMLEGLIKINCFFIKKMISMKYQDGTPMINHLNTFQGIINHLVGMNIKFKEEVKGLWLLGTLSDSWETFRTSLSNLAPNGSITMDLVKSCVLNEEIRRKSQGSSS